MAGCGSATGSRQRRWGRRKACESGLVRHHFRGICYRRSCRSPSKTCVSAYYYPVPATGLTLGRMVLTLAFECWVFADYLPSSFVRGRLASLTSQLVTALHPIDSVVPLTFALAPSASSTCRLCPGCLLVLMPSGPAATALRSPRTNSPPLHAKSHTPTCPAGRGWRSPSRFARSTAGPVRSASLA